MKPIQILFTGLLLASLLPGCEIHDDIDVDVKRKAIVYLRYNYNDGEHDTMDEVQTLRLFFFDLKTGRQYRDTTLTRDEFLTDTGAMQTYISNGEYGIVTLANVGHGSTVSADNLGDAAITFPDTGADPLFFNRIQTPASIRGRLLQKVGPFPPFVGILFFLFLWYYACCFAFSSFTRAGTISKTSPTIP